MASKPLIIAQPQQHSPQLTGWRSALRRLRHAADKAIRSMPSDCPLCGLPASGGDLCAACRNDLDGSVHDAPHRCPRCWLALPRTAMVCPDCTLQKPVFLRAVAAFDYAPPVDTLVSTLKTGLNLSHASMLGRLLADAVRRTPSLPAIAALVPVPASRASLRQRGFNPAREIARALGAELDIPVQSGWLVRTRETGKQSALGRRARQQGADGLYRCPHKLPRLCVAVVDDVMTTGSSQNAAAQALRAAGAATVVALAAARTPYSL